VLCECLTGSPPYRADSIERAVGAHLTEPVPRPSELRPGIPVALDQVIAKGMAKNPEERYRSAGELANAAHDALTTSDQHQSARILQQGQDAAAAATMARPVVSDTGPQGWGPPPAAGTGSWPGQPGVPASARPAGPPGYNQPPRGQQPDFTPGARERRSKRKLWIIIAAAVVLLVAIFGYLVRPHSHQGPAAEKCGQNVLPFNGLNFRLSPGGVALDSAGDVYVTNQGMYGRVVKLTPGSTTPTVLPFTGLYQPQDVAVDSGGTVYVTDFNNRVVTLAAGSNNQTVLPFTGLSYPEGVVVDSGGSVYVADRGNNRVLKLPAGAKDATVLPFDGLSNPDGLAVDGAGNVFVADTDNNRVVKLEAGSNNQVVLPFTGLSVPWGVAVDGAGTVYVTEHDSSEVLKLPAGSNTSTPLPLTGLNTPLQMAVDKDGNVYIADRGNDRVVKLVVAGCPT
ncbi:MAG: SMP-30/gluconolactonase/LRE family protein, partial [Mycobacterium sp.]